MKNLLGKSQKTKPEKREINNSRRIGEVVKEYIKSEE